MPDRRLDSASLDPEFPNRVSAPHARTRRPVVIAVAAVAVAALLAGCTATPTARWKDSPGGGSSEPGAPGIPAAEWEDCEEVAEEVLDGSAPRRISFECATVEVPLDWSDPDNGETLDIALLRARSKRQRDRKGSLVINPGGPGGSGINTAVYLAETLPVQVMKGFDLVGFDPRGVGRSSPVECWDDEDKDTMLGAEPDPVSPQAYDEIVTLTDEMVADCEQKYGDTLKFFSTEQTARDIEAIRQAVGDDKLTYLGYSYGTLLGAVYAKLFPDRIRAMVLDGAVDPGKSEIASSEGQAAGFELAFNNFAKWCKGAGASQCPIAPDARGFVTRLLAKARKAPVEISDGRKATAGWVLAAVVYTMYVQEWWPVLAEGLAAADKGRPEALFRIVDTFNERESDGDYDNSMEVLTMVNCVDEEKSPSVEDIRKLQTDWRKKYPLFGAPLALSILGCAVWPDQHDPYPYGEAKGAPPILVVGTTGDPATPYEQAGVLAKLLGTGVLITFEGEGHTAYPTAGCLNDVINDYLIDLEAPKSEVTCRARE
ncbi:MAG: alpha/beta hydrolase [Micromonosporaceae bacterium]